MPKLPMFQNAAGAAFEEPPPATCAKCGRALDAMFGDDHLACVDWSTRSFPGAPAAAEFRELAASVRRLAQNLEAAAARVEQLGRGWPDRGVERLRAYYALRKRAVDAMHETFRRYG